MDTRSGQLYDSLADALAAGVPRESAIELRGSVAAIANLSRDIAAQRAVERRRAANARAKVARRKSRKR